MRIIWESHKIAGNKDDILAGQIKITVKSPNLAEDVVFMLDESAGKNVSLGSILKNEAAETFTVIAEFVNDSEYNADIDNIEEYVNNNSAMLATLDFDVQVYATQKTSLE